MSYDSFEVARLKSLTVGIVIKAIIVGILFAVTMGNSDMGFLGSVFLMTLLYTTMSAYIAISKACGNWFIGLIVFFGILIGAAVLMEKFQISDGISTLLIIVFLIAGPVLDISRVVRLVKMMRSQNNAIETAETVYVVREDNSSEE